MSRPKWKGPYINSILFKKTSKSNNTNSYTFLNINRNSQIIPKFVDLTFKVHNGKKHIDVTVNESMIGHKFGEFVSTRATFLFKKKKLKK